MTLQAIYNIFCRLMAFVMAVIGLSSCIGEEVEGVPSGNDETTAVSFGTYLRNNRVAASATRAGYLGEIDNDLLKASATGGFGVFATYTGKQAYDWDHSESGKSGSDFNFMYNQQVEYDESLPGTMITKWTYTPLKYWPNDNRPADDQNNDSSNDPAQGSGEEGSHDMVSFFGYAPWVEAAEGEYGITAMSNNTTDSQEATLTYKLTTSHKASENVDLLWARQMDRWKLDMGSDGAGHTNGYVEMHFVHALAKLRVTVQAVIDRISPYDTSTEYPAELDANTRVLIESVKIIEPKNYLQGQLHLVPEESAKERPYWTDLSDEQTGGFNIGDIAAILRYTANPANTANTDDALAELESLPTGVTNTERALTEDEEESFFFIPTNTEEHMKVRIVYYVITYDPSLTLNEPKYFSIVKNDIEGTTNGRLKFEPNKQYTLRLLLGLTTVKFEITVDDWAVPLSLDAVVKDMREVTSEADVE